MLRRTLGKTAVERSAAATVENLEDRRLMAVIQPPIIGIKIAKRVDTDGTALNSNRITVAFDRTVRLNDASKIRSFGYAEDLLNPGQQRKVSVGMTITRDATDGRVLTIITDRLIRKGSRLFINLGAVQDTKGNDVVFDGSSSATTITFTKGQNKPRYTMSNRNWAPTDLSYFSKDTYSSAPNPSTASTQPSSSTIRAALVTHLDKKVASGAITASEKTTALSIYDSSDVAGIIPDANLRAALVSLYGTVAEPAIGSAISKSNASGAKWTFIKFDAGISASAPTGETKMSVSNRLYTYIRPTFAGESFQVLSSIIAREVMRQDAAGSQVGGTENLPDSQDESIVVSAVETIVYAQQLLVDPTVAQSGTGLVARANERLLAILNSGDKLFPYGGILQNAALTNNGNVFPGAKTNPGGYNDNTTVKSFENWIRREYAFRGFAQGGTPTNATSVAILKNIVGQDGNFTQFGVGVQEFLDTRNAILTDVAYIKLAQILKLSY